MKKKEKKYYLRLKDLRNIITTGRIDHAQIMTDLFGYTNNWFTRKFLFIRYFKKAYLLAKELEGVDPLKVEWTEKCSIRRPINIDFISYRAMMELQAYVNNKKDDDDVIDLISHVIAIACYQENVEGDYNSNRGEFKAFREKILKEPALEMFGLYNWISQALINSGKEWDRRFASVYVSDEDYLRAGGDAMSQFNVVLTIKTICNDFNLPYDRAWQMSYNLVQTNSYAVASANYIQDKMRILKEARMKKSRQS